MSDKIDAAFQVEPLEDPHEYFQVRIPSNLRNALEVSLQKSKLSIPVWLRDNNVRALSECLELLHRLAPSIPDVQCTYDDCAKALHESIKKNLLDCKLRFSELLSQPFITHERDIINILMQRNLLVNLSGVRAYMDPVETVEEFDGWVQDRIKEFFKKSLDATDFCEIRMKIESMDKIASLLGNVLPGSVTISRDLTASVEAKVKNLECQIIDVEISESNILQIENSLYKLRQAIDEVQKFLTKKYEFKYVVVHINEGLDRKYWILSSAIRGVIGLQQFDKVQIEHYQLIKTVSNNKKFRAVLDEHPTSEEYTLQNHRSENPSKSFTERRYQCLKELAVTNALQSIESLKQINNPSSALEISSEKYIIAAELLSTLDMSIKQRVDLELTKTIMLMQEYINPIVEQIKSKLSFDKPDYNSLPELFDQLKSCKWMDKYTSNRVTYKEEEVKNYLNSSFKTLINKIRYHFGKRRYDEAGSLYMILDNMGDFPALESLISDSLTLRKDLLDYLQSEIQTLLKESDGQGSERERDRDLFEIDENISSLKRTSKLCEAIGLDDALSKKLKKLKSDADSMVKKWYLAMRSNEDAPKFIDYCGYLDQLKQASELDNFDGNKGWYDEARRICSTRIKQIETDVEENIENNNLGDVPNLIKQLEGASVLVVHFDWIMETIKKVRSTRIGPSRKLC
eukprot:TRINITY_DN2559_c0_g1_i1.p1 TRINITY_DN2559_c0_g1~~TRINITY_DN2559_c0_g1_i1.p1  ORF type:complete len:726 (-),score=102.48 TRINITY_DN2559_c0_g1_i1:1561-3615(-)